jgi:hypothetical protein
MDLFEYLPDFKIQICIPCGHAISPGSLKGHLRRNHGNHAQLHSRDGLQKVVDQLLQVPVIDPHKEPITVPEPGRAHFPCLPRFRGLRCPHCIHICLSERTLLTHMSAKHPSGQKPGRKAKTAIPPEPVPRIEVDCQRFFLRRQGSSFFQVTFVPLKEEVQEQRRLREMRQVLSKEDYIRFHIEQQINTIQDELQSVEACILDNQAPNEVSPWLEMTRWPRYLHRKDMLIVARLARLPDSSTEPELACLTQSLERVVQASHASVCEDKINVFDQARINSFIRQRRAFDRPLMVKLQKSTWRTYIGVWKCLICFARRTSRPDCPIELAHRLTPKQLTLLDQFFEQAHGLLECQKDGSEGRSPTQAPPEREKACVQLQDRLDDLCLQFCISLLDHVLRGDLFESVVVGFFAAKGINEDKQILKEAYDYTPTLSAFIKVAQMLVIQRSVRGAETGEVEHPGDLLDDMRDRFLLHGTHSPFNWALRLRAYGKKIRNSTTSLGYIYWSEDNEKLFYKDIELSMVGLRDFVRIQVQLAQKELRELLLVHPDEQLEGTVPHLRLRNLKDNLAKADSGWNFLKDVRNESELPKGDRWILDRVMMQDWLQDEFLEIKEDGKLRWRTESAQRYLDGDMQFLLRLALVIQLVWGCPARLGELFSLLHSNSPFGHRRSIAIEDGMVGTVTTYHKGYSVSGCTKIIHRYLPLEVGELLVYYIWLVLPFLHHLRQLALRKTERPSPFLWPPENTCWARQFSKFFREEAQAHLKTNLTPQPYRHAAIAISRTHLKCGGFRKDYGLEEKKVDHQSAHTSWTAGTIYARGIEEAPGFVEARRAEFRQVSREWQAFLGFQLCFVNRKRPLTEIINEQAGLDRAPKVRRI